MPKIIYFGLASCYWSTGSAKQAEVFEQQQFPLSLRVAQEEFEAHLYLIDPAFNNTKDEPAVKNNQIFHQPGWNMTASTEGMITYKNNQYPNTQLTVVSTSTEDQLVQELITKEFSNAYADENSMLVVGQWFTVAHRSQCDTYYIPSSVNLSILEKYKVDETIKDRFLLLPSSLKDPIITNNQGLPRINPTLLEIKENKRKESIEIEAEKESLRNMKEHVKTQYPTLIFFSQQNLQEKESARGKMISGRTIQLQWKDGRDSFFKSVTEHDVLASVNAQTGDVTEISTDEIKQNIPGFKVNVFYNS